MSITVTKPSLLATQEKYINLFKKNKRQKKVGLALHINLRNLVSVLTSLKKRVRFKELLKLRRWYVILPHLSQTNHHCVTQVHVNIE